LDTSGGDYVFNCEPKPYADESVHISALCDKRKDCRNGADEMACPGRFYCSSNSSVDWVSPNKLCDHVKDCPSGQDECGTCDMGPLSSTELLISNKVILFSTGLAGLLMIVLNAYVGVQCYQSTPSTNSGKIDRIIRLQVCFFDGLMGLYNLSILAASLVLRSKGAYCLYDQDWRSSEYCSILGVIFSVSSHGSLMAIALMSILRCLTCTRTLFEIKIFAVLIISLVLLALNIMNSIVPVLPYSTIQDIFRTQAFLINFKDNPFINSGIVNVTRLNEIHEKYYDTTADFYKTINNLNNISSREGLFDIVEIGYYGNNRMCTHNVFKEQDSYFIYKLFYFIILLIIVKIVAVAYLIILYKKMKSQQRLSKMGGPENPAMVDEISSMRVKIFLMIGTQILSWISLIIVAGYYHFTDKDPPPMTFEVFDLVMIPVNSLLNPIFYSGLYTKIRKYLCDICTRFMEQLRRLCSSATPPPNGVEMATMNMSDAAMEQQPQPGIEKSGE
jgi:hypothetical protein